MYRDLIEETAGQEVIFIHLIGSLDLIKDRMSKRIGHFMPLSLLESQFETLETPEKPENFIPIDINQPLESIIEQLTQLIKNRC